jgi:hypothetical protein
MLATDDELARLSVPPVMVMAAAPSAAELVACSIPPVRFAELKLLLPLRTRLPTDTINEPNVLLPLRVSAPAPVFKKLEPLMTPLKVFDAPVRLQSSLGLVIEIGALMFRDEPPPLWVIALLTVRMLPPVAPMETVPLLITFATLKLASRMEVEVPKVTLLPEAGTCVLGIQFPALFQKELTAPVQVDCALTALADKRAKTTRIERAPRTFTT